MPEKAVRQVDQARRGLFECALGGAIMHRAKPVTEKLNDYFVIIKRGGNGRRRARRWTWEIQRRSKPLSAKFGGNEYATPQEAKRAGEKALKELVTPLKRD
jgi:hypothetical protein